MRPRRSSRRRLACALLCAALAASGCITVKIQSFPAPLEPCTTEAELLELQAMIPKQETDAAKERKVYLMNRVAGDVSYCQTAEERLR